MRPIPRIAAHQCGVFSTSQALAAGWTHPALRHATLTGGLERLRAGAYQVCDLGLIAPGLGAFEQARWRHAAPAIGAVFSTPGALASHSTAAVLRTIPLVVTPRLPCVSVVPWHTGEIARVHVHRCTSAPHSLPIGEVECTSTERTVIDLAREHGLASGLVAVDFALREALTSFPQLFTELDRCVRWPGVRAAREAIALADPLSESPLESQSRLKFREFGIPQPELQVSIGNEWGGFLGRVDFYWDEFGVVGEADGAVKYDGTDATPLLLEKRRQELLEDVDLGVVRWGTPELRDFAPVAARLRRAFARGRQRPRTDRRWTVLPRL